MRYQRVGLRSATGKFICPATVGSYDVDIGFRPKKVSFFSSKAPGAQSHFCCGIGAADNEGNQHSLTWAGIANNCFKGNSSDTKCISVTNVNGITVEADLVSMTDRGFRLNFTIVNSAFTIRWEAVG